MQQVTRDRNRGAVVKGIEVLFKALFGKDSTHVITHTHNSGFFAGIQRGRSGGNILLHLFSIKLFPRFLTAKKKKIV